MARKNKKEGSVSESFNPAVFEDFGYNQNQQEGQWDERNQDDFEEKEEMSDERIEDIDIDDLNKNLGEATISSEPSLPLQNKQHEKLTSRKPGYEFLEDVNRQSDAEKMMEELQDAAEGEIDSKNNGIAERLSMLVKAECVQTHCTIKERNKKLEDKMRELKERNHDLTTEIELYQKAELNQLTPEEKEKILKKSIQQPYIHSMQKKIQSLQQENTILSSKFRSAIKKLIDIEEEKKSYMTTYEMDRAYAIKKKNLKEAEQNINILNNRREQMEISLQNVEARYQKLIEAYNQRIDDLKATEARINNLRAISKKGKIELVPINADGETKKGFFARLFKRKQ